MPLARVCFLFSVLLLSSCSSRVPPAEVVFRNGVVYTANDQQPKAEAIAVTGGKIVFVGSNADVAPYVGSDTKVVDLGGHTAVPGFVDSHYHLSGVGNRERTLNLESTKNTNLEDFLEKVRAAVAQRRPGEWVTGRGWIESEWPKPVFPTRWDLDKVSPDNPVFLTRADGHGAVANSLGLKIAGIDRNTKNPEGGEIMRDKATGEPNGMIIDKARPLVQSRIPAATEEDLVKNLEVGIAKTLEQGWTTVHVPGGSFAEIDRLKKMYESGRTKLRIYYAVSGPGDESRKLLDQGPVIGLYGNRLNVRSIKVVMDGALGSMGAALLENYENQNTNGFFTADPAEVSAMVEEALKKGVQVMTHAIGDRANREILNIYENALAAVPLAQRKIQEPRLRIEHAQIFHTDDLMRPAKLGVIPSMQPSHAITDLHFAPSRVGIRRLVGAYAWRALIDSGAKIAGGSDAPVERGDPRIEFYAAVARRDLKGFQGEGWHPESKVTREEALNMFTIWAAYASFEENLKGSLEPGKLADITVFSKDIMTVPETEILKAETVMTIVNGEVVYEKQKGRESR
ncbi:MAG: amidohydrolase [Acidobacteria bacterium]|nr:amidohydrolase [Acidobacteriota bacterium]